MRKYIIFISAIIISLVIFIIGCTKEEEFSPVKPSEDSPKPDNINVNPGINGVVINEVYYNNSDANDIRWVEIFNTTDKPVDMTGWLVNPDGGGLMCNCIWCVFGNVMIQPYEYIIGVMYNTANSNIAKLRTKYNIPDNIRIKTGFAVIPNESTLPLPGGDQTYLYLYQLLDENGNQIQTYEEFGSANNPTSQYIDYVNYDGYINDNSECIGTVPEISPGQSIARYKPGLDSNNMADDFYIEDSPTPGRENNQ